MAGQPQGSKITTDHDIVKRWVEEREGKPSFIINPDDNEPVGLAIIFEGEKNYQEKIEKTNWGKFFDYFEEEELAFLYQDETVDGEVSHFYRFINR